MSEKTLILQNQRHKILFRQERIKARSQRKESCLNEVKNLSKERVPLKIMRKCFFVILFIFIAAFSDAQTILKGYVLSSFLKEPLPFATVRIMRNDTLISGSEPNDSGYFEVNVPNKLEGLSLRISAFGYGKMTYPISELVMDSINLFYLENVYTEDDLLFSAKDAKKDIANGLIRFYHYGLPAVPPKVMEEIIKKNGYSYSVTYLSCKINQKIIESVKQYNDYVQSYLDGKYGKEWDKYIAKDVEDYLKKEYNDPAGSDTSR